MSKYCCKECQIKHQRKIEQEKLQEKVKTKKKKEESVKTLNKINHEAKLAGMSYGKYIAEKNKVTIERKW